MRLFLVLFVALSVISCGKNTDKTVLVENPFDSSAIEDQLMSVVQICGQKESALKQNGKLFAVISTIEKEIVRFKDCRGTLVASCEDREQEIELVSDVHLGELMPLGDSARYKLTDGSDITFNVLDGEIVECSNELPEDELE